jgi:RND superfamily putative drug exporter
MRGIDPSFRTFVGGRTAEFVDQRQSIGDHLPIALAIIALATFVVLFLMTGSVVLPVKAIVMNVLTLSAAFGLLVLIFQDGRLEGLLDYESLGALDLTQPVVLFAVAFGLSTDYGVFLLGRIKEARDRGASDRESVAIGLERTGRIVTAAALLFCVAICAFATSQIIFIKELGLGTAFAVLLDATIVRALLVPSLMEMLGRWNWWAPRPLRRLHERIGLGEIAPEPAATVSPSAEIGASA